MRAADLAAKSVDEVKGVRDAAEAMRAYARQAKNKQMEVEASEIRFRAERRLGELIAAQKATVGLATGGGDTSNGSRKVPMQMPPTLAEAGSDKKLSARAQQYAAIPEKQFEGILSERRERIEQENQRVTVNMLEAAKIRGTQGTGENEWCTPADLLDLVRSVLGEIDLDVLQTGGWRFRYGQLSDLDRRFKRLAASHDVLTSWQRGTNNMHAIA